MEDTPPAIRPRPLLARGQRPLKQAAAHNRDLLKHGSDPVSGSGLMPDQTKPKQNPASRGVHFLRHDRLLFLQFKGDLGVREFLIMFATIFVAELGDKTQLATLLFSAERKSPAMAVFLASASALVLGTALAVTLGAVAGKFLDHVPVKLIAGIGFIAIGLFAVSEHFRGL